MCSGGRPLADFQAGTCDRPRVDDTVAGSLTMTADGRWVVWARKAARSAGPDGFVPLIGGEPYPADASARCRAWQHEAPQPGCRCGFHAVSAHPPMLAVAGFGSGGPVYLDVILSGRILAFEWMNGAVLFRAARQTVVRVLAASAASLIPDHLPPDDPAGDRAGRAHDRPHGAGPVRLRLPTETPRPVDVVDDVGYCLLGPGRDRRRHVDSVLATT